MGTATVRLQLQGEPGAISVRAFEVAIRHTFAVMANIEVAISRKPKSTLDWVVTKLAVGSLIIEAQPRRKARHHDISREVAQALVSGLRRVETGEGSPPYLSEEGMRMARSLLNLVGKNGTTGMIISDLADTVTLTSAAASHMAELIPEQQHSIGAVEGRLEANSVHGRPRFTVYLSRTQKAVSCRISEEELVRTAMHFLGRRVLVAGTVHANLRGEPISVEATRIRVFHEPDELPKSRDLRGMDPDFTGDLSTEEFLWSIRGA